MGNNDQKPPTHDKTSDVMKLLFSTLVLSSNMDVILPPDPSTCNVISSLLSSNNMEGHIAANVIMIVSNRTDDANLLSSNNSEVVAASNIIKIDPNCIIASNSLSSNNTKGNEDSNVIMINHNCSKSQFVRESNWDSASFTIWFTYQENVYYSGYVLE